MPPTMDALGAFSYMSDNLPSWIGRVSELAAHTAAKHREYTEAYKKYATVRPRRRKNSSVCSIRTEEICPSALDCGSSIEATQGTPAAGPRPLTSQIRLINNPRKRSADEDSSPDSTEESAGFVSIRHNVVIHYDGHTQKLLEEMVRNIGTARNNVRRGKMSQISLGGVRSGAFGREARVNRPPPVMPSQLESPDGELLAGIRSARNRGPPPGEASQQRGPLRETAFDIADKQLELLHSLCETAAYQVLRYGDCSTELAAVVEKFRILLELATREVQRLKPDVPPETNEEPEAALTVSTGKPNADSHSDKPHASGIEEIEVDDASSISMESIDIKAFRANRLRA
ncbi:uncharacterized protein ACLA_014010 [Aspergillus clavatus NRRL 1]|uniref:Uncharacterized protein n=1 Tax=Aspergillus clavatus (strain ATCC 1007 / CBS 513.65 / DSM 816 / NCTC 3887 / NRRL 1 / QM 1276 / 107) TaxID=344612 RepID=A1CB46_ASPCL|nr:uncharacterized protein ACLA_014010 [Aspergillus clavatus NRRL 1]EAW12964.1 conserved hypothetical protein [Aspergillus clavatus NRRL 1]